MEAGRVRCQNNNSIKDIYKIIGKLRMGLPIILSYRMCIKDL